MIVARLHTHVLLANIKTRHLIIAAVTSKTKDTNC